MSIKPAAAQIECFAGIGKNPIIGKQDDDSRSLGRRRGAVQEERCGGEAKRARIMSTAVPDKAICKLSGRSAVVLCATRLATMRVINVAAVCA